MGNWVWGNTPEARVIRSQAWSVELAAVLSIQDPPGAGRMEKGPRPADNCQPGRLGLSREEFTCSRPGSKWDPGGQPRGLRGSVHTYCSRWGGRQGALLSHSGLERTWTLVFGGPRKMVAIKQQSFALLSLWLAQPRPLVPRWAELGVQNRGCAFSSFC